MIYQGNCTIRRTFARAASDSGVKLIRNISSERVVLQWTILLPESFLCMHKSRLNTCLSEPWNQAHKRWATARTSFWTRAGIFDRRWRWSGRRRCRMHHVWQSLSSACQEGCGYPSPLLQHLLPAYDPTCKQQDAYNLDVQYVKLKCKMPYEAEAILAVRPSCLARLSSDNEGTVSEWHSLHMNFVFLPCLLPNSQWDLHVSDLSFIVIRLACQTWVGSRVRLAELGLTFDCSKELIFRRIFLFLKFGTCNDHVDSVDQASPALFYRSVNFWKVWNAISTVLLSVFWRGGLHSQDRRNAWELHALGLILLDEAVRRSSSIVRCWTKSAALNDVCSLLYWPLTQSEHIRRK